MKKDNNNDRISPKYYTEVGRISILSAEEEKELFEEYKRTGSKAIKDTIIIKNLKLVTAVASKYKNSIVSFDDMVQEGNIGLMMAIDRFELDRDIKFSTYATSWIKKYITDYISSNITPIKMPNTIKTDLYKLFSIKERLFTETGYCPSEDDIAKEMHIDKNTLKKISDKAFSICAIDGDIDKRDEDNDGSLYNTLYDESDCVDSISNADRYKAIAKALNTLNEREKFVIECRYGIGNEDELTLEAIGEKLGGLTRERVRQIEAAAMRKLQKPIILKKLAEVR